MKFRFTLSHPESGASLEITEPDGWKDCTLKLDRHEVFHSLIEYFDGSFIFYGNNGQIDGGVDFIKAVIQEYGIDTTILIDIDITFDELSYSNVYNGQLGIPDSEEMENNKMRMPIIRDDRWAKFISRLDTPVNIQSLLNLDDEVTNNSDKINLKLTSQVIRFRTHASLRNSFIYGFWESPNTYMQIDWDDYPLDEVTTKFSFPVAFNPSLPVEKFSVDFDGEYYIRCKLYFTHVGMIIGGGGSVSFDGYYDLTRTGPDFQIELLINGVTHSVFTQTDLGTDGVDGYSRYTLETTVNLNAKDKVTIMGRVLTATIFLPMLLGSDTVGTGALADIYQQPAGGAVPPDFPSGLTEDNELVVEALTTFPEDDYEAFLLHDVAGYVVDRITGEENVVYSPLLGSAQTRYRQYPEDGCAWTYALIKGLQARKYTLSEKPFFMSFNQWWRGINPILNLSFREDVVDSNTVFIIDHQAGVYDDSEGTSVDFNFVKKITHKYDNDRIWNKVNIGYTKWESEDVSGIDDPQSKKTYAPRFKKVGKGIDLYSEFIGASLALEKTRRTTREKSSDYKYDNETFIIALNPDEQDQSPEESPDILRFIPELDENFSSVNNLLESETRYNLRITPARNFLRWQNYLQGPLQAYLGSSFKFTGGEGNYDMVSTMDPEEGCLNDDFNGDELDEKGDIPVGADYVHLPDLYEVEHPMEYSEYVLIRNQKKKPIGISQSGTGHVSMFIKTLEYKPVKGTFSAIVWAKEYLDLSVVEDHTPMQECQPLADECERALTDELGNILTDELGVCITE